MKDLETFWLEKYVKVFWNLEENKMLDIKYYSLQQSVALFLVGF
jgi:hypothetical protein